MTTVNYTTLRNNLKSYLKKVNDDSEPILVEGNDVLLVSKDEWESLQETLYVLSNSKIMEDIDVSLKQHEKGEYTKYNNVKGLADELGINLD